MSKELVSIEWKLKAMERVKENNALRKRINEVISSRDNFRAKYYDLKNKNAEQELMKKEIEEKELKAKKKVKTKA